MSNLKIIWIFLLLSGCSTYEPETLGYCPTMEHFAREMESDHLILVPFPSSSAALAALGSEVDAVLIGRVAKDSEIGDVVEMRLRDGLTLVSREKRFVYESELQDARIHTYVSKKQAREYIPTANIVYHDSFEKAINEGLDEIVLIDWDDYYDHLELVIPVDSKGDKIEKFRIPVLYE